VQEAFSPELRQEAAHLAATLADLGDPADVRVILFFVCAERGLCSRQTNSHPATAKVRASGALSPRLRSCR
jgi:hypothetical protein